MARAATAASVIFEPLAIFTIRRPLQFAARAATATSVMFVHRERFTVRRPVQFALQYR